jgi:putative MFS transporter
VRSIPGPEAASPIDSSSRFYLIPLKRVHAVLGGLCALGLGIDLLEISINNALAAVFSVGPQALSSGALSWVLACPYIGAVLGAAAIGRIADKRGPQKTLVAALLWMGCMSVLAVAHADSHWFAIFRLLSGLALGGYPPVLIAYLSGISPVRSRGLLIFWVSALAYLMPPAGVYLIRWMTPLHPLGIEGWRWPFLLAGVVALAVGLALLRLPESPQWLVRTGQDRAADEVLKRLESSSAIQWLKATTHPRLKPLDQLPKASPSHPANPFARRLALIIGLYSLLPWTTVSFQLLTGPMLLQRGYGLMDVLHYVAIATFGPTVGAILGGLLVDRAERRTSLIFTGILMGAAACIFFTSEQRLLLATSVVLFGVGVAVYTPIMMTYGAELFAPTVRSTATGIAWSVNRVSAVIVPLLMLPLFASRGPAVVWSVVLLSLTLSLILTARGPLGASGSRC